MKHAITELRTGLRLNKTEFAKLIGISRVYLSNIESGKKVNLSKDLLDRICKVTGTELKIKFV